MGNKKSKKLKSQIQAQTENGDQPGPILLSVMHGLLIASKKPKAQAMAAFLEVLDDTSLEGMLLAVQNHHEEDDNDPAVEDGLQAIILAGVGLSSCFYADNKGGFSATDDEMNQRTHALIPEFVIELVRRRGCFEAIVTSPNPFERKDVKMRGPNHSNIQRTITEFESKGIPIPKALSEFDYPSFFSKSVPFH